MVGRWLVGLLPMVVCLLDCWLVGNGWSLERLISCVDNGNLPFLVDRIKVGCFICFFGQIVSWLVSWLALCLFCWLLWLDCWMVGWLVLRETSVVWTMAICHSSVTERSPQPHYCRQAMPTFFPASAFTILLALLNC